MLRKTFLYLLCVLTIKYSLAASPNQWQSTEQFGESLSSEVLSYNSSNEMDFPQVTDEESAMNTTERDILLWILPEINDTTEGVPEKIFLETQNTTENMLPEVNDTRKTPLPQVDINETQNEGLADSMPSKAELNDAIALDTEIRPDADEKVKESENSDTLAHKSDVFSSIMNERIVLPRNNCNLEIAVGDVEDIKMQIKFEPLKNNSEGQCCITLNGVKHTMLAVLISDICLHHDSNNSAEGEKLEVVTFNAGTSFILKRYYGKTKNYPVLLTQTHKVHVILHYNVITVASNEGQSHFNLEVFTYQKYENDVDKNVQHEGNFHNSYSNSLINYDTQDIFFTTEEPPFNVHYFFKKLFLRY